MAGLDAEFAAFSRLFSGSPTAAFRLVNGAEQF